MLFLLSLLKFTLLIFNLLIFKHLRFPPSEGGQGGGKIKKLKYFYQLITLNHILNIHSQALTT